MISKIILSVILALSISMALIIVCTIISKQTILDREKISPFECGFDPKRSSRIPLYKSN